MTVLFVRVEAGGEDCNGNQVSNREKDKSKMKQNMQDLEELPVNVRAAIKFIPVNHMDQVLKLALEE